MTTTRALTAAVRLIALRPRSEQELLRRLTARFGDEAAAAAVRRLKQEGYVDDLAFAGWWLEQRAAFKPMGARRLMHELARQGVSAAVIRQALAAYPPQAEYDAALAAARRKLPSLAGERAPKRLAAYLARLGFDHPVVNSVLRVLLEHGGDFC